MTDTAMAGQGRRVLKGGNTFGVFDPEGNIRPGRLGRQGLFHCDTRHLSRLELRVEGVLPLLLSSSVSHRGLLLSVDLSNPELGDDLPEDTVHLYRGRFLREGLWREMLRFTSFAERPVRLACTLEVDADFRDIFEVRGEPRKRRGQLREPCVADGALVLGYEGRDGVARRTRIHLGDPRGGAPEASIDGRDVRFRVELPPGGQAVRELTVRCERSGPSEAGSPPSVVEDEERLPPVVALAGGSTEPPGSAAPERSFSEERSAAEAALSGRGDPFADVESSNALFDDWWNRSIADLVMMTTDLPGGPYPYAGVPWYSTPFGRDGIITALQSLWVAPSLARGVLGFLAATRARETVPHREAEPGKILHEARCGEMAALGEVPYGRYYGSVDATPLYLVLAGSYWRRTGDLDFIESIRSSLEAALEWIDTCGDVDGDGFVEYERRGASGLVNQGWKDSDDSVFHRDGRLAEGPVALVEVQAYVHRAWREMAVLFSELGDAERAERLEDRAEELGHRFEETFWDERLGCYVLGLDGRNRPLRVRTSNAGHVLFGGIASPGRARRTASTLMDRSMFSGWGVRTVAAGAPRYNPMSYHNGSVWPHDNALIARGLARYGLVEETSRIFSALFDASLFTDQRRMPELFCGFHRRSGEGPVGYPVACSPQAWASASVCALVRALLGLEVSAPRREVRFHRPWLPPSLDALRIRGLEVGEAELDLEVVRTRVGTSVEVMRQEGPVEVDVLKG